MPIDEVTHMHSFSDEVTHMHSFSEGFAPRTESFSARTEQTDGDQNLPTEACGAMLFRDTCNSCYTMLTGPFAQLCSEVGRQPAKRSLAHQADFGGSHLHSASPSNPDTDTAQPQAQRMCMRAA